MCITTGPATLTDTQLYAGESEYNGKYVHVLAYQNKATNLAGLANAMILPFPAVEEMSQENVIDTRPFPSFLKDIGEASKRRARSMMLGGADSYKSAKAVKVFESGSYTVLLAQSGDTVAIFDAIAELPQNKRPDLSKSFLDDFAVLYPYQPIAICVWEGAVKAEPLLWWYEPKDPYSLFLPTMDAHDGLAPKLGTTVKVDHLISVGSNDKGTGDKIFYSDKIPSAARQLLPDNAFGIKIEQRLANADFWVDIVDLEKTERVTAPTIRRSHKTTSNVFMVSNGEFLMRGWA